MVCHGGTLCVMGLVRIGVSVDAGVAARVALRAGRESRSVSQMAALLLGEAVAGEVLPVGPSGGSASGRVAEKGVTGTTNQPALAGREDAAAPILSGGASLPVPAPVEFPARPESVYSSVPFEEDP